MLAEWKGAARGRMPWWLCLLRPRTARSGAVLLPCRREKRQPCTLYSYSRTAAAALRADDTILYSTPASLSPASPWIRLA